MQRRGYIDLGIAIGIAVTAGFGARYAMLANPTSDPKPPVVATTPTPTPAATPTVVVTPTPPHIQAACEMVCPRPESKKFVNQLSAQRKKTQ